MPISRDPRMDRRRRVLRDNGEEQQSQNTRVRRGQSEDPQESNVRRGAGYSQDVRNACGHRLVQLIPIRLRSYTAVIFASFAIPALLLLSHYMIYVSGRWPWWGHPLAIAFDASHRQGIASWFYTQLWLLCLGATLLTFQLRKHKLDDYNGEYRLWFWLVIVCLIASIDSTTHITELFGLSLNNWTQLNLGWSGPAVVKSTMAVLIGMLGLRLCTELKSVPSSLIFWLLGLVAWAGSAALSQEELKIELTPQFRIWLKCALWLGGLTAIWLAALSYLRSTYIEAQRRFLLRGRLATNAGMPIRQRLRESIPRMPSMPSFRRERNEADDEGVERPARRLLPSFRRRSAAEDEGGTQADAPSRQKSVSKSAPAPRENREAVLEDDAGAAPETRRGLGGFLRRGKHSNQETTAKPLEGKRSAFSGWFRKAKDDDDAAEFRKVKLEQRAEAREQTRLKREERKAEKQSRKAQRPTASNDDSSSTKKRSWVPKLGRPKLPSVRIPKIKSPRSWLPKLKVPSFNLSSLRLNPPQEEESSKPADAEMRPVRDSRPLPGTNDSDDANDSGGRPLTKAERKRQRRLQQQQNRAA